MKEFGAMPVPGSGWAWRFSFLAVLVGSCLSISTPVWAEPFHGFVYEAGTGRKQPLFTLKRTEAREPDGTRQIEGFYTTLEGKDVVHEIARIRNHRLIKYIQEQNQLGAWGVLEPRGPRIHFEWVNAKHEMSTGDEEYPPNLIVGATSIDYLRDHWGDILDGKDVGVRAAVLERQDTVGFKFFMTRREKRDGKDLIHVKMKPTSIFVQLVVKPFELVFERKTVRLVELRGRVGLKRRVGNDWKDLETEMVYFYDDVKLPDSESQR